MKRKLVTDHVRFVAEVYTKVRDAWTLTTYGYPMMSEAMIAGRHWAERATGVVVAEFTTDDADRFERRVLARVGDPPQDT